MSEYWLENVEGIWNMNSNWNVESRELMLIENKWNDADLNVMQSRHLFS